MVVKGAGFVGFADRGPLDLPVPIEDLGQFRDLFGGPVRLAWSELEGRWNTGNLHAAVEAFFLNGGERCWIVPGCRPNWRRPAVAGPAIASENAIPVPGLVTGADTPATCRARAPGTWAYSLEVETALRRERLVTTAAPKKPDEHLHLTLAAPAASLARGDLLELEYASESLVVFLAVVTASAANATSLESPRLIDCVTVEGQIFTYGQPGSPLADPEGKPGRPDLNTVLGDIVSRTPDRVHRLTFDIVTRTGRAPERRVSSLGFISSHPRFWAQLPDDATLFQRRDGARQPPANPDLDALYSDVRSPRLDISGPAAAVAQEIYLPIGMRALGAPPEPPADTLVDEAALEAARLADNGLEDFSDSLFLDADLAAMTASSLITGFENKAYQRAEKVSGLHALLGIEEIAALAVPDATHTGWARGTTTHPFLPAPDLEATAADQYNRLKLSWSPVAGAARYRLEVSASPNFESSEVIANRGLEASSASDSVSTSAFFPLPETCPEQHHFRVRAENDLLIGPWSNELRRSLPPAPEAEAFRGCDRPILRWGAAAGSILPTVSPPATYQLETATEPQFLSGERLLLTDTEFLPDSIADSLRYFRVRILPESGVPGPWSNPVVLQPETEGSWLTRATAEFDPEPLLAVQHALIRLCAARCDAIALLALPRHYRIEDALGHLSALQPSDAARRVLGMSGVPSITTQEAGGSASPVYSYAVLSHPWVRYRDPSGSADTGVIARPPEGFMAGVYAARTRSGGAWLAPANVPLVGALGIEPPLGREDIARLSAARITVLHPHPRGILWTGDDTLSAARLIGLVNVRRLMILLRRFLLREGRRFVFEPHSDDFRALVRGQLTRVLTSLYQRGAFRGADAGQAFQVVIEEVNNPPQAVDLGRLVVDLAVAPAAPLQFLHLRLLQIEPERLTVEELV